MPGSGKSTLAIALGKVLKIPVHHLDTCCFNGSVRRDQKEMIGMQQRLVNQEAWIIEGCSITTLDIRFERADLVIYLDFPRLVCFWRIFRRIVIRDSELDSSGCLTGVNWTLLKYIWNFKTEKSGRIEALRAQYPSLNFRRFKNTGELEQFLRGSCITLS